MAKKQAPGPRYVRDRTRRETEHAEASEAVDARMAATTTIRVTAADRAHRGWRGRPGKRVERGIQRVLRGTENPEVLRPRVTRETLKEIQRLNPPDKPLPDVARGKGPTPLDYRLRYIPARKN